MKLSKGVFVKYYDKVADYWEEGILCDEVINAKKNIWKVYFPSNFIRNESYFLAMEVKDGEPQKDDCAYRVNYEWN